MEKINLKWVSGRSWYYIHFSLKGKDIITFSSLCISSEFSYYFTDGFLIVTKTLYTKTILFVHTHTDFVMREKNKNKETDRPIQQQVKRHNSSYTTYRAALIRFVREETRNHLKNTHTLVRMYTTRYDFGRKSGEPNNYKAYIV